MRTEIKSSEFSTLEVSEEPVDLFRLSCETGSGSIVIT
jgi:hypothetical protein